MCSDNGKSPRIWSYGTSSCNGFQIATVCPSNWDKKRCLACSGHTGRHAGSLKHLLTLFGGARVWGRPCPAYNLTFGTLDFFRYYQICQLPTWLGCFYRLCGAQHNILLIPSFFFFCGLTARVSAGSWECPLMHAGIVQRRLCLLHFLHNFVKESTTTKPASQNLLGCA